VIVSVTVTAKQPVTIDLEVEMDGDMPTDLVDQSVWMFELEDKVTKALDDKAGAAQKVRSQEQGHEHIERLLVSYGAVAMARGEDPTAWLGRALIQAGTRCVRHAGNHRYAFVVGRTSTERRHVALAMAARPYPKIIDQEVHAA